MIPRPLVGTARVAADGTFTATIQLFSCSPTDPVGTQFIINAQQDGVFMNDLALATFTVTSGPAGSGSPSPVPGLPNTGGGAAVQPMANTTIALGAMLAVLLAALHPVLGRRPEN
jgi:hypothetical protein